VRIGRPFHDFRLAESIVLVRGQYFLHPTDTSVCQHHLDAMRMGRAISEHSCNDALGLQTRALVLFLNYPHP